MNQETRKSGIREAGIEEMGSDLERKAVTVAASERAQRASFKARTLPEFMDS